MQHGIATAKRDIVFAEEEFSWNWFNHCPPPPDVLKSSYAGLITAYLPDMEKFAISLRTGSLITFSVTEEEFKDLFEVELFNKENQDETDG